MCHIPSNGRLVMNCEIRRIHMETTSRCFFVSSWLKTLTRPR
jgi:hypothetical protein